MFTRFNKSVGMALVIGLTPLMLSVNPTFAQAQPTASTTQTQKAATQQAQPGSDFNTASAPLAGWVQIAPNGTQWYKFKYHYDNSDSSNTPTQALVKLQMETSNSISFSVWTAGGLTNPIHNDKDMKNGKPDHSNDKPQPVGYGTPMTEGNVHQSDIDAGLFTNKDKGEAITVAQTLVWSGGAQASDTYYVIVRNTTNAPVNYHISISGPDVSFAQ